MNNSFKNILTNSKNREKKLNKKKTIIHISTFLPQNWGKNEYVHG